MRSVFFKCFITLLAFVYTPIVFAQFTEAKQKIHDDLQTIDYSKPNSLGKKGAANPKSCAGDTIDYGRYKASSFVGINISTGYRLGQYYETPGEVTVSGFDFYAWQNMNSTHVVEVYCQLFEAGADSLPSGTPIRSDTIYVDSTFGGGSLAVLKKQAIFDTPYKTSKPYILVLVSNDTNRVAVVTNSYRDNDGADENLACGTVGGRWFQFDDLNIGGIPLNCDVILEPYVKYDIYADFSFKDCYDYQDTVKFKNESSPFIFSRVYNRYEYFGYSNFCHRWDYYGFGSSYYTVEGQVKYTTPQNYKVRLISSIYSYRGGGTCIDTTYKDLSFQPSEITFAGDKNVCSGNFAFVSAQTSGKVEWYRSPLDTAIILNGPAYSTASELETNDTAYAKAVNNQCVTPRKRNIITVTKTPELPTISNDSVCLNSLANLVAKSNAGSIRWFEDSTGLLPVYTGDVFQVGPLNSDTFFFAKAINAGCTHDGRIRATAFVNNAFAPTAPTVSKDTTVCLLSNPFYVHANSSNSLRWYDVAAGGKSFSNSDSVLITPQNRGLQRVFVESYDGSCASSRLPIAVTVNHFPELSNLKDLSGCEGDILLFDYTDLEGDINWYDEVTETTPFFTGTDQVFPGITESDTFFLEPFEGNCFDSIKHRLIVEAIPFASIANSTMDTAICDGSIPTLEIIPDAGTVTWYEDEYLESILSDQNSYNPGPIDEDLRVYYQLENRGCISPAQFHDVEWLLMPDGNFDYQVSWRNVEFATRLINQGEYVWTFDDDTDTSMGTDVKHYFAEDGDYDVTLIVTSPRNCIDTVIKTVVINTLSVDDPNLSSINLYPNPVVSGQPLNLVADIPFRYEIIDSKGSLVVPKSEEKLSGIQTISTNKFTTGVYLIRIEVGDEILTKQIVIQ